MRYLYTLYAVITFGLLFLLFLPLFFLLSFGGRKGKLAMWWLIKSWSYIWLFLVGISVKRKFIAKPRRNQRYIVVANHQSYLDTAMLFNTMPFMVKPLARNDLAKIPLFGFLYRQMAILVDRSDIKSKGESLQMLTEELQAGGSIFIFPEGSFNETAASLKRFFDGAFRLAIKTRTPLLPVLFPDTKDRLHYRSFWAWSPGKSRAVFLPEISVDTYHENDVQALKEHVFQKMEAALISLQEKSSQAHADT